MTIQKQPNNFTCLPTAFAMVLDVPVFEVIKELGHDGSQIVFPQSPEPWNMGGWHPQEFKLLCWNHGFSVTEFFKTTVLKNHLTGEKIKFDPFDFRKVLFGNMGVCCTIKHAYAWDGMTLINPADGERYSLDAIEELIKVYLVTKRKQQDDLR